MMKYFRICAQNVGLEEYTFNNLKDLRFLKGFGKVFLSNIVYYKKVIKKGVISNE